MKIIRVVYPDELPRRKPRSESLELLTGSGSAQGKKSRLNNGLEWIPLELLPLLVVMLAERDVAIFGGSSQEWSRTIRRLSVGMRKILNGRNRWVRSKRTCCPTWALEDNVPNCLAMMGDPDTTFLAMLQKHAVLETIMDAIEHCKLTVALDPIVVATSPAAAAAMDQEDDAEEDMHMNGHEQQLLQLQPQQQQQEMHDQDGIIIINTQHDDAVALEWARTHLSPEAAMYCVLRRSDETHLDSSVQPRRFALALLECDVFSTNNERIPFPVELQRQPTSALVVSDTSPPTLKIELQLSASVQLSFSLLFLQTRMERRAWSVHKCRTKALMRSGARPVNVDDILIPDSHSQQTTST